MPVFKNESNGTWYVMSRYVNWKGERKQKCKRGFATKREAQEWERMFQLQNSSDMDMSFEAFTELYIRDMKSRLKENTWMTKEHIIRTKILPYFGKLKISEISTKEVIACGTIASMLTLGNCIGSITGPIVFSKIKNVKVFVSGAAVLSFAGIIMCWRFPSIFVLHILVLYTGIMLGASMPIFLSAPVLLEGIGTKYAGSAAGVISTLQLLGAVLIPTYILTPIAGDNYSLLFMLASICMVIMFLCGLLLPQFGNNQK